MPVAIQKRTTKRSRVLLLAGLEAGGQQQEVRIRDVSTAGALVEVASELPAGQTVVLHCGDTSVEGRLSWSDGSWSGIEFTQFAWYRISELAELPLWVIHIAWPITGITWLVFLGEQMWDELNVLLGRGTLPPADPIPTPEGPL